MHGTKKKICKVKYRRFSMFRYLEDNCREKSDSIELRQNLFD